MMKLLLLAGALALATLSLVSSAFAQTTVAVGDFYTAFVPYLAAIIGSVLSVLVGWALVLVNRKLGVSVDDSMRDSLQTAVRNGAGLLLNSLGNELKGKTIDVKNPAVAAAVNYVAKSAPDALDHFGITPDQVAQKVVALLPQVANTATPPKS